MMIKYNVIKIASYEARYRDYKFLQYDFHYIACCNYTILFDHSVYIFINYIYIYKFQSTLEKEKLRKITRKIFKY